MQPLDCSHGLRYIAAQSVKLVLSKINGVAILVLFPIAICVLLFIALRLIDIGATEYDQHPDPQIDGSPQPHD